MLGNDGLVMIPSRMTDHSKEVEIVLEVSTHSVLRWLMIYKENQPLTPLIQCILLYSFGGENIFHMTLLFSSG